MGPPTAVGTSIILLITKICTLFLSQCRLGNKTATCEDLHQTIGGTQYYRVDGLLTSNMTSCDTWTTFEISTNRPKLVTLDAFSGDAHLPWTTFVFWCFPEAPFESTPKSNLPSTNCRRRFIHVCTVWSSLCDAYVTGGWKTVLNCVHATLISCSICQDLLCDVIENVVLRNIPVRLRAQPFFIQLQRSSNPTVGGGFWPICLTKEPLSEGTPAFLLLWLLSLKQKSHSHSWTVQHKRWTNTYN